MKAWTTKPKKIGELALTLHLNHHVQRQVMSAFMIFWSSMGFPRVKKELDFTGSTFL